MRTTATYTVATTPTVARDLVAAFLAEEGLAPRPQPGWDGSAMGQSCALRFDVADEWQGYAVEVHIRDRGEPGVQRCAVELRQDVCAFGEGSSGAPRRPAVVVAHLDDRLRRSLDRGGVVERVEMFV
jgi:hypothetical protein